MRIYYASILLLYALFFAVLPKTSACGYDWVGDCSSALHLRINGTLDSFDIADCPSGIRYEGLHLGTLKSLSLANAKAITWESCFNNVTGVDLKYRLYEQGGGVGAFQTLALNEDYFILDGAYTTRYRSKNSNLDLTTGLIVGKTYVLEVYLSAAIDTLGDDFIPETVITKNNNGQNYRITFTYGGNNAAPFVVVPTKVKTPNCHGESNGSIAVSVWGDQTGLFYNWSNIPLNFYQQNGLPSGTYTVTVTGANHTATRSIVLGQPDPLIIQNSNIQPVGCGGGQGSISVQANGGTMPYHYLWTNGQTTATAVFSNIGNYALSLTDAHNCILAQSFNLPGGGTVQQSSSRTICMGQSIIVGGTILNAPGVYTLNIPGNGACDTLLTLTVSQIDPSVLLASLPSTILLTCNTPTLNLCAETSPTAFYQWSKDGIPATQTPCLLASAGGIYTLSVIEQGCSAAKSVMAEEHLVDPVVNAGGLLGYIMDCYVIDSTVIEYESTTNAIGPQYEWLMNGQVLSTAKNFTLLRDGADIVDPEVSLRVTDQFGCDRTVQATIFILFPPMEPYIDLFGFTPNLCDNLQTSQYYISGGNDNYLVTWNDSISIGHEISLSPGEYTVKITNVEGCVSEKTVHVPPIFQATIQDSPFPNSNFGAINIYYSDWLTFQWSNGSMSPSIYNLAPGVYCVTMTDQNDCMLDTCFTVNGSVSTLESNPSILQTSPNPVYIGDWMDIQVPDNFLGNEVLLLLMDSQGQIISREKRLNITSRQRFRLSTDLPSGIYYLQLTSINGQAIGKLSLKK